MSLTRKIAVMLGVACGVSSAGAQPANDACQSARSITAFGTFSFTTVNATTDGVPNVACAIFSGQQMYDDVWFCWTPAVEGPTRLRACSNMMFDTSFEVFDGCSCPEGSAVIGCDDQGCSLQHSVVWNAQSGHTYLIRVGGFQEGSFGAGTITIGRPGIVAGPIENPNNGHTYYLTEPQTWDNAEELARVYGGHLATIRSQDENDWIRATLGFADETFHRMWIGLNDPTGNRQFDWVNGEPVVFTNWDAGQPDNANGNERAVMLDGASGFWSDEDGSSPSNVVYGTIEVIPGPPACRCDWNHTSTVDSQDFFDFLSDFFADRADFNESGATDSQDFFDFLGCFFTGCPG